MLRLIYTLLVCFSLWPGAGRAQLRVGGALGAQSSYFLIDQIPNTIGEATSGAMLGYRAACSAHYSFSSTLSLRTGLSYSLHRINWGFQPYWVGGEQIYELPYLSVALVAELTPTKRWHIIGGAEVARLLRAPSQDEEWQQSDISLLIGAGFAILPDLHINFEHAVGLPRIGEGRFLAEENRIDGVYYFRTRSIRVSLTYYFLGLK